MTILPPTRARWVASGMANRGTWRPQLDGLGLKPHRWIEPWAPLLIGQHFILLATMSFRRPTQTNVSRLLRSVAKSWILKNSRSFWYWDGDRRKILPVVFKAPGVCHCPIVSGERDADHVTESNRSRRNSKKERIARFWWVPSHVRVLRWGLPPGMSTVYYFRPAYILSSQLRFFKTCLAMHIMVFLLLWKCPLQRKIIKDEFEIAFKTLNSNYEIISVIISFLLD